MLSMSVGVAFMDHLIKLNNHSRELWLSSRAIIRFGKRTLTDSCWFI